MNLELVWQTSCDLRITILLGHYKFCKKVVEATLQAKLELLKCNLCNLKRMTGDGRKDTSPRNNVHGMRAIVERRMQTTFSKITF
jgi:hypothetical protein